jgi:hypothetical protein
MIYDEDAVRNKYGLNEAAGRRNVPNTAELYNFLKVFRIVI